MVKEVIDQQNQVFYDCPSCGHRDSRVLEIDPSIKIKKTQDGWMHFTAGALIVDHFQNPQKFLIIKKRKHPYLYDVVAGHINKNEMPKQTLKREVQEEVGSIIHQQKLLLNITIKPDPCRRGVDIHQWFLFLCTLKKEITPDKDEVANVRWYTRKELKKLEFVSPTQKMLKILKLR
jgi:8-oxo-dGTP pyrophosphatase MutT (NUDIX family)